MRTAVRLGQRMAMAVAIVLLSTACGSGGRGGSGETVDLPSLRVKLRALTTDSCHSEPEAQPPYACEKFVTQLGNTAATVAAAGRSGTPALAEPARRMKSGVRAYRDGDCRTKRPKSEQACYAALAAIAQATTDVEAELEKTEPE